MLREGELRYTWTSNPSTTPAYELTQYTFTGQYAYMDDPTTTGVTEGFGLMFYNARWYDPYLNHFTQPDSIVPDPYNPQDWNRYAYARNNPLKYTDPSGHCAVWGDDWCFMPSPPKKEQQLPPLPPNETGHLDSDEFGRAILGRYLKGDGDWNIITDPDWSDYMANNPTLKEDLELRAIENAQFMLNNGYSSIYIDESYPMEIENGEAMIGYQYLHGTNQDVGGFHRLGVATMSQNPDGNYQATFWMSYTWNDVIDPNPQYITDVVKSNFAEIITLGKATPYTIRISWTQTIFIQLGPNGNVFP